MLQYFFYREAWEQKWNFWRLSVYELAENEIFLRHWSSGN